MNHKNCFGLLLIVLLLFPLAAWGQGQPDPNSPRGQAVSKLRLLLEAEDAVLEQIIADHIAPSLKDEKGANLKAFIQNIRQTVKGLARNGLRPVNAITAATSFNHEQGVIGLQVSAEEAPPHRLTKLIMTEPKGMEPAREDSDMAARIRAFVNEQAEQGAFSGAVLVAQGGEVVLQEAWGLADRETGRANTIDTPINLGSMNKMFTGLAIGLLEAEGRLSYLDTVGKYLPDYPVEKVRDEVTIHQLLTHTAGFPSYWNEAYTARKNEISTMEGFLATFIDEPLVAEPGTGFNYSNGGPVVLGLIIEAVTGQSYFDFIQTRIYQPAGMTHSDHYHKTNRDVARGYFQPEGQTTWTNNQEWLGLVGSAAGGGYSTVTDLFRFAQALADERLLNHAALQGVWYPEKRGGESTRMHYGYLWGARETNGRTSVGHNGGAPGISADFRYYPESGDVVVVLGNQSGAARNVSRWINNLITSQ